MSFVPLKPKSSVLKLVDIYGKWLIGKFIQKTKSDFSYIYSIEDEAGIITKIYGNKSLDQYMDNSLLGETIAITCTEIKDTGKAYPFAKAGVALWDPNTPIENQKPAADPNMPTPIKFD